jgi:hypothetical protein
MAFKITPAVAIYQPPSGDRARKFFAKSHLAPHHTLPAGSTVFVIIVTPSKFRRLCEWFDAGAMASAVYNFVKHQCRDHVFEDEFGLFRIRAGNRPFRKYRGLEMAVEGLADASNETQFHEAGLTETIRWLDPAVPLSKQIDGGVQRMTLLLLSRQWDDPM